jgi:hypothetical protein
MRRWRRRAGPPINRGANVNDPADGRLRALYAAAAASLDIGAFLVQALWLVCVVALAGFVLAIAGGAYHAIF